MPALRWAFLVPTAMLILYLVLGYALDGTSGLAAHYNTEVANLVPIVILATIYLALIIIWFKVSAGRPQTIHVRQMKTR